MVLRYPETLAEAATSDSQTFLLGDDDSGLVLRANTRYFITIQVPPIDFLLLTTNYSDETSTDGWTLDNRTYWRFNDRPFEVLNPVTPFRLQIFGLPVP